MMDEVEHQRETSHSALSSINHPPKRERDEDQDEEMTMASNEQEGSQIHDQSLPTSAIDNSSQAHETSVNVDSLGDEDEIAGGDEIGVDFTITEGEDTGQTYADHIA